MVCAFNFFDVAPIRDFLANSRKHRRIAVAHHVFVYEAMICNAGVETLDDHLLLHPRGGARVISEARVLLRCQVCSGSSGTNNTIFVFYPEVKEFFCPGTNYASLKTKKVTEFS